MNHLGNISELHKLKIVIYLVLVIISSNGYTQEKKKLRHTTTDEFKCDFYVDLNSTTRLHKDTVQYFWFKSQAIHVTQGGSDGKLLNGPFSKFYHSGQLAEKGVFKLGLKQGEWRSWYESGKLKSVYFYRSGMAKGRYFLYNDNGELIESGKIKNGVRKVDQAENLIKKEKPDHKKPKKDKEFKERQKQEKKAERQQKEGFFKKVFKKKKK